MNNENRHPNYTMDYQQTSNPTIANKLATMLAVIVSFQQKIEILRVKICGHPNFSPELYYKQIDRCQKGFIDSEDIVTFIKKSKPTFNVDHRYLKSLFVRLNQDERVPSDRLTYFGYLNIIKPYFDNSLARDLLLRDSVAIGTQINVVAKKLLQDLICTLYVCVAEHERVKQLIIIGDLQQGGRDEGNLYNVYQMLQIIKQGSHSNTIPINIQSEPIIRTNTNIITSRNINTQNNIQTNLNIPQSYNQQIRSTTSISPNNPISNLNIPSHNNTNTNININTHQNIRSGISIESNLSRRTKPSILDSFHQFILNNSQYQIQRGDMKYLLAYLMCHQYMITNDKYLTLLFMPVSALVSIPNPSSPKLNQPQKHFYQSQNVITSGQTNFLGFVHKNSVTRQAVEQERKKRQLNSKRHPPPQQNPNPNPQKRYQSQKDINNNSKLIDQQPRILINPSKNNLQTPILQKFLRESKVLKNMSRYKQQIQIQQQSSITSQSSAFIMEGNSVKKNSIKKKYLDPNINKEHTQKPINKDFSLHDMLENSNMQRSQYYNNLNLRAYIKDEPLKPAQIISPRKNYDIDDNTSGILNNFMRK